MTEKRRENPGAGPHAEDTVDPLRLLAQLPLRPYHLIGDLRSGRGDLTITLAKHTFDGRVYATDASPRARKSLREKVALARLTNVTVFDPKDESKSVPAEGLDGVLLALALSATRDRVALFKRVAGLLKRGAWAAVVEWYKRSDEDGPPIEQRMSEEEVTALGREGGFRFSERRALSSRHYLVILRR